LDDLLAAADAALAVGLSSGPERVVVIGGAPATARFGRPGPDAMAGFGAPGAEFPVAPLGFGGALPPPRPPVLPLSLSVGRQLLDRAGWAGPRQFWAVHEAAAPAECVALGKRLTDGPSVLLLVLGDGSGVGRNAPPGAAVAAAEPFDDAVWAALSTADAAALLRVDPVGAAELKAAGRAAWQVLAGAVEAAGGQWSASALHRECPYGVGYFVAAWQRR
jgi:hypothetical protein